MVLIWYILCFRAKKTGASTSVEEVLRSQSPVTNVVQIEDSDFYPEDVSGLLLLMETVG